MIGLAGVVRVLLHGRSQLFHRGRGFFQRRGLLLGAARQVGVARRNLARAHVDFFHPAAHRGHGARQAFLHALDRREQMADFIGAAHLDAAGEIARGNLLEMAASFTQRPQHGAVDEDPAAQGQRQGDRQHHDGDGTRHSVRHPGLDDQLVGAGIHKGQDFAHGFAQRRVRRAAGVVQIQIFLHRHAGERRGLALEQAVELLVGAFKLAIHGLGAWQARRLAIGIERLGAVLHQAFRALCLRGGLLGLALLHVHQGRSQ
ncbi:hypothetical protein FQZ97_862190 [compost metagenome]